MRSPFVLVLLLGLGLAGLAVWMVQGSISAKEAELVQARAVGSQVVPLSRVWAAAGPLRYGETVAQEALTLIDWPARAVPEGAYVEEDGAAALFPDDDARPRLVLRAMDAGEIVLAAKVTEPGGEAGITALLEPGMRAFSIRVDETTGVSGFLRPGDLIDVFWTGRIGEVESTRLVETGIEIIAVDQSAAMDELTTRVANTISVMGTPAQVAGLTHAQSTGRLTLSLVGVNETGVAEAVEMNDALLFGIAAPEPEPEPEIVELAQEKVCSIRTRRGGEVTQVPIPCTN